MKKQKYYSIELMRIIAAFTVVYMHFDMPGRVGRQLHAYACFSVPFFFMVSGYFVLGDMGMGREQLQQKILKNFKNILRIFLYAVIAYAFIDVMWLLYQHKSVFEILLRKRTLFSFVFLNEWPFEICGPIWYLHALVYAYAILYFMCRKNLMKYDTVIMIVLLILNSVLGEFSRVFPVNILGYTVIKGNFFTRALPYLLVGRTVRKYEKYLLHISNKVLIFIMITSLLCVTAEYYILNNLGFLDYKGHFLGNGFFVLALFVFLLKNPNLGKGTALQKLGTEVSLAVYIIHKPVGFFINRFLNKTGVKPLINARSLVIFAVTLCIALSYYKIKTYIKMRKPEKV